MGILGCEGALLLAYYLCLLQMSVYYNMYVLQLPSGSIDIVWM